VLVGKIKFRDQVHEIDQRDLTNQTNCPVPRQARVLHYRSQGEARRSLML